MVSYSFYESDTRMLQYAAALVGRGDTVDVIALRRKGTARFEILEGVRVFRIQSRNVNEKGRITYLTRIVWFLFLSMFVLAWKHSTNRYQVIHVHSVPDFLVFAAALPKLLGARVILDIHDILPEFYASKFGAGRESLIFKALVLVEKVSIAFADHVIIANHIWLERLCSRSTGVNKCTTILNYPDNRIFQIRPDRPSHSTFLITYPGTLNFHQGLDVAIRAFASVADQMLAAEFHIYGEGPTKSFLMQLTEELGMTHRVFFHDFLPCKEIAEIMARSDLAVVPKRASSLFGNEAASTKIAEFMSLGVPLIVSRTKVDTFYLDDSMVRFFESENESDLADSLLLLWRDPKLRTQLSTNAFRYVKENSWQAKQRDYLSLVDDLTSPARLARNCEGQC